MPASAHRSAEALLHNHPDISTLRVRTADYGGQSFHNGRLGAVAEPGQELRLAADAEVQPVGPTTLALTGEAIEVRQPLHAHRLQRQPPPLQLHLPARTAGDQEPARRGRGAPDGPQGDRVPARRPR